MEIKAILLASSMDQADAESLRSQGIDVRIPARKRLSDLAASALEIRQQHPRLPLIVSAAERQLRHFERRYPSLVDVAVPNATAGLVLAALPSAS